MNKTEGFYTMKSYRQNEGTGLTSAMEDYLEMICRISRKNDRIRVGELSRLLHVKPSSVTKMLRQLNYSGYINAEKYGGITITEKGLAAGDYLLRRHNIVHRFLCALNRSENELEQTEKIEHFLNRTTVENIDRLTIRLLNSKREY